MAIEIVVIGTSLGGMRALQAVLAPLPPEFPAPIVVVQHRGTDTGDALKMVVRRYSQLKVQEPQDKEEVRGPNIYLAPADYHLMVDEGLFWLSTAGPVSYARPSIDVLFESAADSYGPDVIAVLLTGANRDGARGCTTVKNSGGVVVVQDPETAESAIMPRAAIAATAVDAVLTLPEIAPFLIRVCREDSEAYRGK